MIEQADCVLIFGAGLNFLTTSFGESLPDAPLVQIDRNRAAINQWTTTDISIVGDARLVAEQLLEAVPERSAEEKPFHVEETRQMLADFDIGSDFQPQNTARTLDLMLNHVRTIDAALLMVTHDHSLLDRFDRVVDFARLQVS